MNTPRTALLAAIDTAGNQTLLAQALTQCLQRHPLPEMRERRITQAHIACWLRRGRVASDMCVPIEKITGVSRSYLRPDVFQEVAF